MRIFALSDIHTDFKENLAWVRQLSREDYQQDLLILAGDIAHDLSLVSQTFKVLKGCFKEVFFVPGNHDLWTVNFAGDSLDKCREVLMRAEVYGVKTLPEKIGSTYIIPLQGWYDLSFGPLGTQIQEAWQDFVWCRWPRSMGLSEVTEYFLSQNPAPEPTIEADAIVTFSHFLPRVDVMPSYIPEKHRIVYPVLGTNRLDEQVRGWNAQYHIYGHSHVNRKVTIEGVTYINNALGYPNETRICRRELFDVLALSGTEPDTRV